MVAAACGDDDDGGDNAQADSSQDNASNGNDDASGNGDDGASEGEGSDTGADNEGSDATTDAGDGMTPQSGGTFTYGIISDGTGFNTLEGVGEGAIRIIGSVIDTVVVIDENGDWVPLLAESLVPNDDATVWTVTLNPGIKFHDGVDLDAEALKANWDKFKAAPNVGFAFAAVDEVVVVDDLTVEVIMNRPWAAFPHALVGTPGWILSPDTIGQTDKIVGTGAFMLEEWTPGDSARVVRNPNYWLDPELPYLDEVVFKVIPEQTARRQALEAGDIDAYCCPGDSDILDFQNSSDIDVYISSGSANEILYLLNTTTAPTDDVRVRKAMAHAIDQQLIIDTFRSGLTTPAKSFISPNSEFWIDTDYPDFDLDAARALIDEYEAEVGPVELELNVSKLASAIEVSELVVSLWSEVGIDATINEVQPGTEVPIVIGDAFQAQFWAQFSGFDPDAEYVFFHSSGGLLNWTNLVSEKLDAGFDQGRESFDDAERAAGYAAVQEVFAEEVPILWIDHLSGTEGVAADPRVHGITGRELADGTIIQDFLGGSYFGFAQVWIEQE